MGFTHLQIRSGYSMMNSAITLRKLVEQAKQQQFHALALTDEQVLYGAIPFYKLCKEYQIKPILGMIMKVINDDGRIDHCILLAKNNEGFKQLIHLSSDIKINHLQGISKSELKKNCNDLIGILPISESHFRKDLLEQSFKDIHIQLAEWQNIFAPGDFYLGIQDHGHAWERQLNEVLHAYTEVYSIPVAAIQDVRYLKEQDVAAFDALQAMKHGEQWDGKHISQEHRQRHLRSAEEMKEKFETVWPEALEATEQIQASCQVSFRFDEKLLPQFPLPDGEDGHTYLEKLCIKNAAQKYGGISEAVQSRLNYELGIIQSMNYSDYFLIVWDFIKYAKKRHIMVGPGRGSSASSLVAYVLGITEVDPLQHELLFERFLNPERVSMPDIDIDFSDYRRDEVIEYVRNKYGQEHVAQIITFGTFQSRSILRELIKTMDIHAQDARFILKEMPQQTSKHMTEIVKASPELKQYIQQSDQLKLLFSVAAKLEGLPRHASTHAAGVVISRDPLMDHVPLTAGSNETHLTQFPMNDLESLGLLKFDFLGLRNLTLLEKIVQHIYQAEGKEIDLRALPEFDEATFELLRQGKTNGVFQLESEGMKDVLIRLKPNEFADIVAVNALYRPGPMAFIQTYIDRKHGKESVQYPHPDLEQILNYSYGVLIYQEQIMQIANRIAGYSMGQADILRRAVSKKNQELMDTQKEAFIQGCKNNGYEHHIGESLFAWIVKFSNYGFPKSHAVAYSKISYSLAYLKAHYPTYFYAELLSSVSNQLDKIHAYTAEMREMGIRLLPPSINKSFSKYAVEEEGIRIGLAAIKGVGNQVVKEIIAARKDRPFKDLFDFCLRVSGKSINRATIQLLITAGAFDETYPNRASLLASLDPALEQGELFRDFQDQSSLFDLDLEASYVEIEDFSQMKKLADEKELLGIYLSSHPLKSHRKALNNHGFIAFSEVGKQVGKRRVKTVAIIDNIKTIRTKRGEPMAFLVVADEFKEMEAVIFPELYRNNKTWLEEEKIVSILGSLEIRNHRVQWLINEIQPFNPETLSKAARRVFIKLVDKDRNQALAFIRKIANMNPGPAPIIIYDQEKKRTFQLSRDYHISADESSIKKLKDFFGNKYVVLEDG
ncbi:DNA polymerase III subunit alpha [Ornithinibacillus gellani]|uniref:DNA polymerase III subunit alpha n=1 Tax=Ornithinibacillus gellani TaxID=2293253 RepID=UPI000F46977B|nr:DNA polymerase III subunit alpha [Ornithinibacillus gellani]TQS76252.1 DNA polymerase III subunit alpha [Ornithinibacillus gellani]